MASSDDHRIEIREAPLAEKPLIGNLMELYIYDFTQFPGGEHLDESGRFGFDRLDSYWQEPHRHPFLLRVGGHPAGFALVRIGIEALTGEPGINDVTEFFVMRAYRRTGAGEAMARDVCGTASPAAGRSARSLRTRRRRRSSVPSSAGTREAGTRSCNGTTNNGAAPSSSSIAASA